MATPEAIAELRRLIDEATQATYTDLVLSARIDAASGNLNTVAGAVWTEKAATYSGLIDIQEGNSNRKLSQLQGQALKMAASFGADTSGASSAKRPARTRRIERQ